MKKFVFSFANYREILRIFKSSGREVGGVADFFQGKLKKPAVIIRHDVDRRLSKAISFAQLENELGIRSTYYFRASPRGNFTFSAIKRIVDLGHEVGYHYETYSFCRGDFSAAIELFEKNLQKFRQVFPCLTVSAHGSPLSFYDNLDLLKGVSLKSLGLIAEAVLSFENEDLVYFTDAGGAWNANKLLNRRDRMIASTREVFFEMESLLNLLRNSDKNFYFNIHPERWFENSFDLIVCRGNDFAAKIVKKFVLGRKNR